MGISTAIIIISSIILIIYIFSKVGHNSAEFFDGSNYKDFTSNNKNLDNILQSFSKLAYKPNSELKNISNSYILTKNNLDTPLKQEVESVITKVLDKINSIYSTKYKLTDLERIKVETNILRETQVSIIFFILFESVTSPYLIIKFGLSIKWFIRSVLIMEALRIIP